MMGFREVSAEIPQGLPMPRSDSNDRIDILGEMHVKPALGDQTGLFNGAWQSQTIK